MNWLDNLPSSWATVDLGTLSTQIQYGLTATADNNSDGVLYLRISDLNDEGHAHLREPRYVPESVANVEKYGLVPGDIVIARSGSIGRSFVYKGSERPWVFASYLIRFRPNQELADPDYLGFYLRSPLYWHKIKNIGHTVAQPNINSQELSAISIPMPPLPEQRRIADILRQADMLRQWRQEVNTKLDKLLASIFIHEFGYPHEWKSTLPLGSLVEFVGGGTPSRKIKRYFTGDIPWATSKDIKSRYLTDTQEHIMDEAVQNSATNLVPAKTILVVVKSKILIHSLPIGITTRSFCFGQDVKGLICNPGVIPQFIVTAMLAQTDYILKQARGVNTEGLTLDILRAIPIPDIDTNQQKEFLDRVLTYDELEKNSNSSCTQLDALFASLSTRAFTGELTAVWREKNKEVLKRAAVERDKILGLRSRIATMKDAIEGRLMPEEEEQLRQALGNFAVNTTNMFESLRQPMLETMRALIDMNKSVFEPALQSIRQNLQNTAANLNPIFPSIDREDVMRHIDALPVPQEKRAVIETFDTTTLRVLKLAGTCPAYFTADDLETGEIGGITAPQAEASLRTLQAIGFVKLVQIDGLLRYRLIDEKDYADLPTGLQL